MVSTKRRSLDEYLALQYPFNVVADKEGGYVILFPDLPGCMTQVERIEEVPAAAEEIRTLWIETEYEEGEDIPLPSYPEEYSGKFNVRLPKSLHRSLVEAANREGVSLNQYVVTLLARGDALWRIESQLDGVSRSIPQIPYRFTNIPQSRGQGQRNLRLLDPVAA
jgi:predicted RNase H-like HicB family nuclease